MEGNELQASYCALSLWPLEEHMPVNSEAAPGTRIRELQFLAVLGVPCSAGDPVWASHERSMHPNPLGQRNILREEGWVMKGELQEQQNRDGQREWSEVRGGAGRGETPRKRSSHSLRRKYKSREIAQR